MDPNDQVSISDFVKLDIRTARVLSAEHHPDADKLMVLKIDTGLDHRQIVAGIRGHYEPETLVGRTIVILANLKPARLRGQLSQGMLLAASDDEGTLRLLTVDGEIAPGSRVS